jgi:hypothetical protein
MLPDGSTRIRPERVEMAIKSCVKIKAEGKYGAISQFTDVTADAQGDNICPA